jgi:uncharacterized protein (UPF0548 family)
MIIGLDSSTDPVLQQGVRSFQRTVPGKGGRGHLPDWDMPFRLRFSNRDLADQLRRDAIGQDLTYLEIGASLERQLPAGYHHSRAVIELGVGERAFGLASDALREWAGHAYLGIAITPDHAPLEAGVVVVAEIPLGPVLVFAPCRIVSVVSEVNSFGFAYGTLPGHPERGEESFVVRRGADDIVRFEVAAFSSPSGYLVRLGGPFPRWIQQRATRGYLEGVRRFVAAKSA